MTRLTDDQYVIALWVLAVGILFLAWLTGIGVMFVIGLLALLSAAVTTVLYVREHAGGGSGGSGELP